MPTRRLLAETETSPQMEALNQGLQKPWRIENGHLVKDFRFADFVQAFGFMTQIALMAERLDHHPDWSNCHAAVTIKLRTHDAGGLTALDFTLAVMINHLAD